MSALSFSAQARRVATALALTGAFSLSAHAALAQDDYPNKTVTIHVGWAAGGIVDIAARLLADSLTTQWGQQVVVQNTPGAGGVISVGQAALTPADGYNIVAASSSEITSNRYVQENWVPHYDEDFFPVALLSLTPSVLVVHGNAPYETLDEIVAAAKAAPGDIAVSTTGVGSASHLAALLFAQHADVDLKYVPFPGGAPAAVAVAGGETALGLLAISSALPHIESGAIKVVGLVSAERFPPVGDWPTLTEAGLDDFEYGVWSALYLREGTPEAVVAKIREGVAAFLSDPASNERLAAIGAELAPILSAEELLARIEADKARDADIVSGAGIVAQ